jgi:phosphopantothenoylcysteine decarboxylase/phosphopantothenate--cysteine ligase
MKEAVRQPLIALGVTGCIGAYKSAELLRRLQDRGYEIQPILTKAAQQFITPLTLQTLAQRPAICDMFAPTGEWDVKHISLSDSIDLLLVAPATADILAKFARGIADDFLSTFYLSTEKPVCIAPAMNAKMWRHPATRENVEILRARGVSFVQPGTGYLACGWEGEGRLAAIEEIVDGVGYALHTDKSLAGRRVLVTTGPTVEDLDPMRSITNRSSGRMGIELAREAKARGADVTLIAGPISLRVPYDVTSVPVRSAAEMHDAVMARLDDTDILCMVAAVADYRPAEFNKEKMKKGSASLTISLVPTVDILAEIGARDKKPFLVGFAAESGDLHTYGHGKLASKRADIIVANPIGEGGVAGAEQTRGLIICADGTEIEVPHVSKAHMAANIFDVVEARVKR